tara:strand:- start:371 stop:769 length:399 start_codon:yes stop_codon:yes gene_type:complete
MSEQFKQISIKPGFMKHNGGLLFRIISENEYQFKSTISKNHLNKAGITHGGYIASLIDAGSGTAVHRSTNTNSYVTVSLDIKFIASTKDRDQILGFIKVLKKTNSMVFVICHLECNNKIIASASGVWKKLKN